jgi:hypothetical protein
MKPIIILLLLIAPIVSVKAAPFQKTLPDGWYYAQVAYYNYATYVSADYNLKVKVKDGMVTVIRLNDGGVVHNGVNNDGYQYTGGKIEANQEKKTGKMEYATQISISNGRSITSYNISISQDTPDEQP